MKIPRPTQVLPGLIYEQMESSHDDTPREHLGASQIGQPCERRLWLQFRWAFRPKFPGRILRLFRRGHLEEEQVLQDLASVEGVEIKEGSGQESFSDHGGHFGGSVDGIILSGVPGSTKSPHILEVKTHNKKSFSDLVSKGVQESKPLHYDQMQSYMLGLGIERALYVAVCKDDDEIYTERVKLDREHAEKLRDKALRVITIDEPPAPISDDPSWFQCKFCPAAKVCRGWVLPEINCRTCAHSTPITEGDGARWHCARWETEIPGKADQLAGCPDHVWNPRMMHWHQLESDDPLTAFYQMSDGVVGNGPGGWRSVDFRESKYDPDQVPF